MVVPISVAAWSKMQVSCCSLARIAGSNPAGGMDVRLLCLFCVVYVAAYAMS